MQPKIKENQLKKYKINYSPQRRRKIAILKILDWYYHIRYTLINPIVILIEMKKNYLEYLALYLCNMTVLYRLEKLFFPEYLYQFILNVDIRYLHWYNVKWDHSFMFWQINQFERKSFAEKIGACFLFLW